MSKSNNGRNDNKGNGTKNERRQQYQPGAPNKSNRQSKGYEKDESGAERNTTMKQSNSI